MKQSFADDGRPTFDWAPREFHNSVAWTIADISFPDELPDWLFNPNTYAAHKDESLPTALSAIGIPPTYPVIRHLVFAYSAKREPTERERLEGQSCALLTTSAISSPAQFDSTGCGEELATGTITINVIAELDDGALVVDVSPIQNRAVPFARVAISANGDLTYDSRIHLVLEQAAVLRLLGRKVIGSVQRQTGENWSLRQNNNGTMSVAYFSSVDIQKPANEQSQLNKIVSEQVRTQSEELWRGLLDYDLRCSFQSAPHSFFRRGRPKVDCLNRSSF